MEQKNQQSIPEKTDTKPPIKTNWKFLAIVVVLGLVSVGGIFLLRTMGPAPSPTPSPTENIQTLQGMLKFTSLEGGCWYLEVRIPPADPVRGFPGLMKYELQGFSENQLEQYRDQQVEVRGRIREDMSSICQIGTIFEVRKIYSTAENESNQQSTIETSDWQTYRNEEFGFEVRYPSSYEIYEQDEKSVRIWLTGYRATIYLSVISPVNSLDGYVKSYLEEKTSLSMARQHKIEISGFSAIQLEVFDEHAGFPSLETFIRNATQNIIVAIRMKDESDPPFRDKELDPTVQQIYNQILSTFRFIE